MIFKWEITLPKLYFKNIILASYVGNELIAINGDKKDQIQLY